MKKRKLLSVITLISLLAAPPWGVQKGFAAYGPDPSINYNLPNYANSPLPVFNSYSGTVKPGTGIRKFVDSLPGLNAAGANNLGQYIPVAIPDTASYPGSEYYEIELGEYCERMHSDLPCTKLRGYRQTNTADPTVSQFHYLGPLIIATKDVPVRIKFTNKLPSTANGGDLFLPVDTTVMGAGSGPDGQPYTQNRGTLHLHGGNTPWISDGTPHQWTVPADETSTTHKKGVSTQDVPDMGLPSDGSITFYYPNQQSGRLMFYHDHSYGITRLNVYGGEAAGYLLTDTNERGLTPGMPEVPLVIQDKTFVPDAAQLAATDPTWNSTKWGGLGSLWLPHVWMPNQDPTSIDGSNPMGRWDWGPWFWPVFPSANPYPPNPTIVPEAFMDTPTVNGTAYPFMDVQPVAYRFRILNACNDRMLNLQLYRASSIVSGITVTAAGSGYTSPTVTISGGGGTGATAVATVAAGQITGITLLTVGSGYTAAPTIAITDPTGTGATATATIHTDPTEVGMVPANPGFWPAGWGTPDGRAGGLPDPSLRGPAMIEIGSEGGVLPAPVVHENVPIGYDYNRRSITVLNVLEHTLYMGPAERADVIIDFSQYAGQTLLLYNDAPAPNPGFDPRYDYFTANPDYTSTGGAPSTLAGYGPNTRTVMQIRVAGTAAATPPPVNAYDTNILTGLQTALPAAFAATQAAPIVPAGTYARIQDTSLTFQNGTLGNLALTNGGSGYTAAPAVSFTGGGGTGAAATATLSAAVGSLSLTNGGSGYTSAPAVAITSADGNGSGATATATLASTSVASVTVVNRGSGYTSVPTVTISGGGGTGATAVATVTNRRVTAITITNGGTGYTSVPTVTITGGGGSGATATAALTPTAVASLTLTNPGSGYSTAPSVTFSGGGGTGAAATSALAPGTVGSLTLTNAGAGYTTAPTVAITSVDANGSGATATVAVAIITMAMQPKTIQELFEPDYGRMNATLGVEMPFTSALIQTTIPYFYIDPPTEIIKDGETQLWKITHNGVDTHAIHFHLFNAQLVNRVGWDGAIKPPDDNELGWKDTIKMNPLEDIVVAVQAMRQVGLPWELPNSVRPMDVTQPIGSTMGFTDFDPTNQPVTVTNQMVNFGWEYVWHCHLLGHEENDMMRPMIMAVVPDAATGLAAILGGTTSRPNVTLNWTDSSVNETGWSVQRATAATGPWTTIGTVSSTTGAAKGGIITFTDNSPAKKTTYFYRVIANNVVGYTQVFAAPAVGYPHPSVDSVPTTAISIATK